MDEFDLDRYLAQCVNVHEMLDQADYWVDVRGRVHRLDQMSVRYKANCLTYLRKRAARLGSMYVWGMIGALSLPSGWVAVDQGGRPVGEGLTRGAMFSDGGGNMDAAFDEHWEQTDRAVKADPIRWLEDTTLYKALAEQVLAGEGGAVGDRPEDEPRAVTGDSACPGCGRGAGNPEKHQRSGPLARLCTGEWVRITRHI